MPEGEGNTRTYSITTDTAAGGIDPELLKSQIESDVAITTALRSGDDGGWFDSSGVAARVYFAANLSAPEVVALDAVLAAHDHTYEPPRYAIWQYVSEPSSRHTYSRDGYRLPIDVNYKTGLERRLHPVRTFDEKGRVITTIYYANGSGTSWLDQTFDTPVVREDVTYTDDAAGFVQHRDTEICWYLDDGTVAPNTPHKTLRKFYTPQESLNEGVRRRSNIVESIEITLLGFLKQALVGQAKVQPLAGTHAAGVWTAEQVTVEGRSFAAAHKIDIQNYKDEAFTDLQAAFAAATESWLDLEIVPGVLTVRNWMIAKLNQVPM